MFVRFFIKHIFLISFFLYGLSGSMLIYAITPKNASFHDELSEDNFFTNVDIINERYEGGGGDEQGNEKKLLRKENYDKKYLTGDWKGWRQKLVEKGIIIISTFQEDILGNPIGGKRQGMAHDDSWATDFTLDLDKLYGCKELLFYTSFVVRGGSNLSATTIGNEFPVAQLYGGETWRLNELYFKKTLLNDYVHIKLGRLNCGNDFLQSPLYYNFVNNAFCGNPIGIFFNTNFFAFPFAVWGAYFDVKVSKLSAKAAIYNSDREVLKNSTHGCYFACKAKDGKLFITEWAYLHNQEIHANGLPGNYRIGAYYSTGKKDKFRGGMTEGNLRSIIGSYRSYYPSKLYGIFYNRDGISLVGLFI